MDCYRNKSILGKGTYGMVYMVEHLATGTDEVMKVIDISNCDNSVREEAENEVYKLQLC